MPLSRTDAETTPAAEELTRCRLGIAEYRVVTEPAVLTTSGLGSCVGVGLFDTEGRGGLAHCMLPSASEAGDADPAKPAKYVDTAVSTLREELIANGASPTALRAKVAGGSDMLGFSDGPTVGERNARAATEELNSHGIPVVATDTGGEQGRSLEFETATGRLTSDAADGSSTVL